MNVGRVKKERGKVKERTWKGQGKNVEGSRNERWKGQECTLEGAKRVSKIYVGRVQDLRWKGKTSTLEESNIYVGRETNK